MTRRGRGSTGHSRPAALPEEGYRAPSPVRHTGAGGLVVDFHGEFLRVEEPSLIEWTFGFDDVPPGPETMHLIETDGGMTLMRSVSTFPSKEVRDAVLGSGMQDGASTMHDRFDELLARLRAEG